MHFHWNYHSFTRTLTIFTPDLDSIDLHKLCRTGKLEKIKQIVKSMDPEVLCIKLATQKGVFGFSVT